MKRFLNGLPEFLSLRELPKVSLRASFKEVVLIVYFVLVVLRLCILNFDVSYQGSVIYMERDLV